MLTTGERLAAAQVQGHQRLNAIYQPLARDVETLVLAQATPDERGISRLTETGVILALFGIARLLRRVQPEIVGAIVATVHQAIDAAEAGFDPVLTPESTAATFGVIVQANQSLNEANPQVIEQTESILRRGVAAGLAASAVGKMARQYFFLADRFAGVLQSWPGRANMASQRARMVMLTESTAAHARTTHTIAVEINMGMKWNLSPGHPKADECDTNGHRSSRGQDQGVYTPQDFPRMPTHPRCRCYSSIVPLRSVT